MPDFFFFWRVFFLKKGLHVRQFVPAAAASLAKSGSFVNDPSTIVYLTPWCKSFLVFRLIGEAPAAVAVLVASGESKAGLPPAPLPSVCGFRHDSRALRATYANVAKIVHENNNTIYFLNFFGSRLHSAFEK